MTPAQERHLRNIVDPDPAFRGTSAGYYCRKGGLSEWMWEMSDGSLVRQSEVDKMEKPLPRDRCLRRVHSEVLTKAGHDALNSTK